KGGAANRYGLITKDAAHLVYTTDTKIATVELDPLLDEALARQNAASGGAKIDYVHGDDALIAAVNKTPGAAGILLPPFSRKHLFKTISEKGPLPRKSFSMGEPLEKRFYLEARRLFDL
ncbi:MAG: DUF1015 domain-containing protein, partial [Spirochaetaceae bacterium]|nr:DUF1015 domain-containing protein [Spirochaetaceae bacterium]